MGYPEGWTEEQLILEWCRDYETMWCMLADSLEEIEARLTEAGVEW